MNPLYKEKPDARVFNEMSNEELESAWIKLLWDLQPEDVPHAFYYCIDLAAKGWENKHLATTTNKSEKENTE